ncbi:MAG TPA: general stress protein, partial [Bacillota bacterium]|nr:general stress protein [Bacillota bacterium]
MEKTVIAYYNSRDEAESSVRQLREQGFDNNEISILAKDDQGGSGEEMSFQNQNLADGTMTGGA